MARECKTKAHAREPRPLGSGGVPRSLTLSAPTGRRYWRSLEELCETSEFADYMHREFPEQASTWTDPVTRRQFLMLMGASFALAGLAGCSPRPAPAEKIMPYVRQPEGLVPG